MIEFKNRRMTDQDFRRLGKFIENQYGIKMPASKRLMLQARLQKRLRELGHTDFKDYINYVFSPEGRDEILRMIDEVTTNKTEFFRETEQFESLHKIVLPELLKKKRGRTKFIDIWSAGCSTGEEPYSIAMICNEFSLLKPEFEYEILATDLSMKVLQHAKRAIYSKQNIEAIPLQLRKKYLLKSKKQPDEIFRIAPEIRSRVKFRQHNLMANQNFMDKKFDIIFCRNVMIYFDAFKQADLCKKFYQHLNSEGFLFIGYSETLMNCRVPFKMVESKIYQKA